MDPPQDRAISRGAAEVSDAGVHAARPRVAVIIPCFKVTRSIAGVVAGIGDWAHAIYCVDDACPEDSAAAIDAVARTDPRVTLVRRTVNGGVGAATMTGYAAALADGADILVKMDGDGQMDPDIAPRLIRPILRGEADYAKGNRFFRVEDVAQMPRVRVIGNAGLSFMSKLSTGYWDLFDPTNGYTALEARVARQLPWDRVHPRWFFESDLLFRLGVLRARVVEVPIVATYAEEESNLSELHALLTFPFLHGRNLLKRIAYNYFLRNFSMATVNLLVGNALFIGGATFGAWRWAALSSRGDVATSGTVMLAALPILLGLQLVLQFLSFDIGATPSRALHPELPDR